jgi:hypothetical protein
MKTVTLKLSEDQFNHLVDVLENAEDNLCSYIGQVEADLDLYKSIARARMVTKKVIRAWKATNADKTR